MCGIVGIQRIAPDATRAAIDRLHHRGTDASGVWTHPSGVSLGHSRLAIIDLEHSADQPMQCARTGNVIVFNGEMYNYRSVRRVLEDRGWNFRTRSDTEVLLAAYGEWGSDCLERIDGMFAFSIFDRAAGRIVLARDRMGKKPLFYTRAGGTLAWASEIKALFSLQPALSRRGNLDALRTYLDLGYVPGEQTIYSEIRRLPPAHYAVSSLATGTFSLSSYWSVPCSESAAARSRSLWAP